MDTVEAEFPNCLLHVVQVFVSVGMHLFQFYYTVRLGSVCVCVCVCVWGGGGGNRRHMTVTGRTVQHGFKKKKRPPTTAIVMRAERQLVTDSQIGNSQLHIYIYMVPTAH